MISHERGGQFLWGVASSGYQCEGGYNGVGQPQNNWAAYEQSGDVQATGDATSFWTRYEEDLARARDLGLKAFRLSIEWPRVQPTTENRNSAEPPPFDLAALDHYADIVAAVRRHGLEPVVTLQHFTHPAWLGLNAWLEERIVGLFEIFVATTVAHVNRRLVEHHGVAPIHWYVTLNEPNMLILNTYIHRHFPGSGPGGIQVGATAYNHLLAAHVLAYNAIHDCYESAGWPAPMVAMNTFCSDAYWSEQFLLDMLCVRERGIAPYDMSDYFQSNARALRQAKYAEKLPLSSDLFVWIGRFLHFLTDFFAPAYANAETFTYFLKVLNASKRARVLDYIGLDYYDPFTGHLFRPPSFHDLEFKSKSLPGHLFNGISRKWWDWHVIPDGLGFFCRYYAKAYQRGILIAENGMAIRRKFDNSAAGHRRDKVVRSEFLKAHIGVVRQLVAEGIPMIGYLHWSITDNYEWGSYTPRFGLFAVDYMKNAERSAIDHLGDDPSATYARLIREEPLHGPRHL